MVREVVQRWLPSGRQLVLSRSFWFRFAIVLILGVAFSLRQTYIKQALPYCHHVDENTWTQRSIAMLQTNDLNPHRFTKPSVMAYLNTAGLALGLVRAGTHQGDVYQPRKLGPSGYPYYNSVTAISTLRTIYAGLSVLGMLLAALSVHEIFRNRAATILSLAMMAASGQYFHYSVAYLNVDILGVFFSTLAVWYALTRAPKTPPIPAAAVMGVLAGLTLGCKYNLFWIAVPLLYQIFWSSTKHTMERVVLFFVCMIGTFIVTTPYAIFDVHTFVKQAAYEAHHYASGHKSRTFPAGFPMFMQYLKNMGSRYSVLLLIVAVFGLLRIAQRNVRGAVVAFSYSLLLLFYMCTQRTFFPRNTLTLSLTIPMMAAIGFVELFTLGSTWLNDRFAKVRPRVRQLGLGVGIAASVLLTSPWAHTADQFDMKVESRNLAIDWIVKNVPKGSELLIAEELDFYSKPLKSKYEVRRYAVTKDSFEKLKSRHPGAYILVPTIHQKGYDFAAKGKPLVKFGRKKVDLKPARVNLRIASGNPRIRIYKL